MTVKELIEKLQRCDPNVDVTLADVKYGDVYEIDSVDDSVNERVELNFEGGEMSLACARRLLLVNSGYIPWQERR